VYIYYKLCDIYVTIIHNTTPYFPSRPCPSVRKPQLSKYFLVFPFFLYSSSYAVTDLELADVLPHVRIFTRLHRGNSHRYISSCVILCKHAFFFHLFFCGGDGLGMHIVHNIRRMTVTLNPKFFSAISPLFPYSPAVIQRALYHSYTTSTHFAASIVCILLHSYTNTVS